MEFTARMIAEFLGGAVIEGDENVTISSFAKIEEGCPGALSFLANPKYTHYIYDTKSSAVLVSEDFKPERQVATTLIRVADPYAALSVLMTEVNKMLNPLPTGIEQPSYAGANLKTGEDIYLGAFSYVGNNVTLGRAVKIYPHTYIGHHVTIGDGTVIYPGVKIYHGVKIGRNCIIHAGAVIGADGFGFAPLADGSYKKIPQLGIVEIGDNVEIGANTTIDRATMGCTRIADGAKIDNLVQVAHNVTVGRNTAIAAQAGIAGSAHLGSHCVVAGQVGISGHITIGDNVAIGAKSGVPKSVESNSNIMGYPAVQYNTFARQAAMMRRLPEIFDTVARLKKESES